MKKTSFITIILFLFLLWFWSYKGADFNLQIIQKDKQITVFLDDVLLGKANNKKAVVDKIRVDFTYQDLEGKYFQNQSRSDKKEVGISGNEFKVNFVLFNPFVTKIFFNGDKNFSFSFAPYRHLSSDWFDAEKVLDNTQVFRVRITPVKGLKWIFWILFKPFPFLIPIVFLLYFFSRRRVELPQPNLKQNNILFILPIFLALISFFWSVYLMAKYTKGIPHVPDSVCYLILSKIIASGKLIIPISELPFNLPLEINQKIFSHWFVFRNNYLFVPYQIGHPLILAIGYLFHIQQITPPLVGSTVLLLIFLLTYRLTRSILFSLLAEVICLLSPFFQTQTIDFMSHNTAAMFILLSILPVFGEKEKNYLFTGFFLGMTLNTRPLTFIAVFAAIVFYEVALLVSQRKIVSFLKKILFSAIGALLPVFLFLYYNYLTTGNWLISPYYYHGVLDKIGFGVGKDFQIGYGILQGMSNLAVFSFFFLRNYYFSFAPFLVSFFLVPFYGKNILKIFFCQLLIIAIFFVWVFCDGNFFMYGPRFIYELVPVLAVLYGVVFYYLFRMFSGMMWPLTLFKRRVTLSFARLIFSGLLIYFVFNLAIFESQWLGLKKPEYYGVVFVPSNIKELIGFNYSDERFLKLYQKHKGEDKIYFMKDCDNWVCTGQGFYLDSFPLLKSKPLFLRLPDEFQFDQFTNAEIIDWKKMK